MKTLIYFAIIFLTQTLHAQTGNTGIGSSTSNINPSLGLAATNNGLSLNKYNWKYHLTYTGPGDVSTAMEADPVRTYLSIFKE